MSFPNFPFDSFENALRNIPITQTVHSLVVAFALPPVIILTFLLQKIALHINCKFLLYTWLGAFCLSILSHASYIIVEIVSGKYLPSFAGDSPAARGYILGVHGFAHAFSSVQELLFSIERTLACANPSRYHDRSLSITPLLLAEIAAIGLAFFYSILLKADNLLLGCCITNTIDIISLLCLVTTKIWTDKKKKKLLLSGLNEKYQIREAFEITRVMLPCGVISLVMKLSAMAFAWMFVLHLFDPIYAFTLTSGLYFIIETTNCLICSVIFLSKHQKLRTTVQQITCRRKVQISPQSAAAGSVSEVYFNSLKNDWK